MGFPEAAEFVVSNQTFFWLAKSAVAGADVFDEPVTEITGFDVILIPLTFSTIIRVVCFHLSHIPSSVSIALGSIVFTEFPVVSSLVPYSGADAFVEFISEFVQDCPEIVRHYMLGFLLFEAALEMKQKMLERIWSTVLAQSIFPTMISTIIVGVLTYLLMQSVMEMMEFNYGLLFSAIVSPTDPVAVISIVNEKSISFRKALNTL